VAKKIKKDEYEIKAAGAKQVAAPKLDYLPPKTKYRPPIGLIGCGGITSAHLSNYKAAGYKVVALCDVDRNRAEGRRKEFFPNATVYTDYRELLKRDDIEVVDIATHPPERPPLIEAALRARKHVLSQKPFAIDLSVGERLCDLADKMGVKLAVNQNGRWAPHFSYIRAAIREGILGKVFAAHLSVHWNHNFIKGTPFDKIRHIALYDFGIHWFDITTTFFGGKLPKRVYASFTRAPRQEAKMPLLAQAILEYDHGQASLAFDADVKIGPQDRTFVAGDKGTASSVGPDLTHQTLTLTTAKGVAVPKLEGSWFTNGFHGTMAELLASIEQKRQPSNAARTVLAGLATCFAACRSADTGRPQTPGKVRKLPL
jgi:predicted dehydrogenase